MRLFTIIGDTLAGKTTHLRWLAKDHGVLYISSGEIARSLMDGKTEASFAQGGLSPHDDKIIKCIANLIDQWETGYGGRQNPQMVLLDGFPRISKHREVIEHWFQTCWPGMAPCALFLDVPFEVILKRSHDRARDQFDTPEIAAKRHELFERETKPVFSGMRRTHWLKFAVRLKQEETASVVHTYIEKIYKNYWCWSPLSGKLG